ncbi:GNAT family N-acetyltransferase [Paraglaciecola aquimarina]|uniref:GNAT family N-acetyltransferase n=1 Tax=Paraglaciecola algarum TaxID=3050085 RepID=A0ABS9D849_9ALTE|nr:GNAT family protein [Paraglaciecola sp. G1-23]MCF2948970.1 GNAT family N-acetyltransferase [Paraglaciecola sp. G1-23]
MKINVSPNITIRLFTPEDHVTLFTVIEQNREYLKQWLSWLDLVKTSSDSQTFIETCIYRHNNQESSSFGVFYQTQLVGIAGFNKFDFANKSAEIGYWLAQAYCGKGIITSVVNTLLDYGFKDLELNKVEIHCAVNNLKSRAIPERLGFTFEANLRQREWLYDSFVDHAVYSLLKREFTQ